MRADTPALPGVLTAHEVAETAASIVRVQRADGGIPWAANDLHIDPWNHVEAAMALLVAGEIEAAERAYGWTLSHQRTDGSWPMRVTDGAIEDPSADTNMCAYLAVGVWHHWLVRRDESFVRRYWPAVRRALDYVAGLQLPFGGIAWSQEHSLEGEPGRVNEDGLLAGSSSIYHSFKAGVALSELMDEPQPEWEIVAGRLGHAVREHRDRFLDKSNFSMDWYYPVLGGSVRGEAGFELLASRWHEFVEPGYGIRCVLENRWLTGAETCELAMALDSLGDRERALELVRNIQHTRHAEGSYWTGYVLPDDVYWPEEQTTYTSAAVILAVDALSNTTPGSAIFRGTTLPPDFEEIALECGCSDARILS
ncbi:MAG TPA: prenyltransferase [Nocardioidaceae bacterium]|nr:prenyltransferase [Nocardioidaceae bacterium]